MGLILKSASFNTNGDAGRDHDTMRAVEKAGFEVDKVKEIDPDFREQDTSHLTDDQRLQKNANDYGKQVEAAKRKYGETDWNAALNQEIVIGQTAQLAMLEAPNGAEIAYYLGQHPEEARRLGKMTPLQQAGEVRALSDRLPKPQRVSRPVRPPADATFAEIAAMKPYPGKARDLKRASRR